MIRGSTLLGACASLAVATVAAQSMVAVPVDHEPQHHPVFRNAVVSVLDVRLPPGYVSLFHVHAHDNVSVRIDTALTRIDTPSGTGVPQTPPVGRVVFNSATPPYTHRVANVGASPIRIVDIEVLATQAAVVAPGADDMDGHDVVVDNARVRLSRVTVDAGHSTPAHRHARGWLEVEVRGPEPGRFVWHDAGSTAPAVEAGTSVLEWVEVEVK